MPVVGVRALSLLGLLTLGLLSACQDPSGVGLGLIGEEGADPNLVLLVPDSLFSATSPDVTGGFADGTTPAQARVLVGAAADPDFGDVAAEAYLDIRPPTSVPSGFRERTLTSATLRLRRDYVYGEASATLNVALSGMAASWNPIGAASDTSFAVGDLLATYDLAAPDTAYTLALPSSWLAANNALLRSDSVDTAFDGFQLRLADGALGGAVLGLDVARSVLRLTTSEDTVDYPIREVFSHVERGPAATPPADTFVLRDGTGEAFAFAPPFDGLGDVAVARASFRLSAEPGLLDAGMLTRSLPPQLLLRGVLNGGATFFLAAADLDAASGTYTFSSSTLANVAQDAVLGASIFVRYEIAPAPTPAALDVLPITTGPAPGEGDAERRPRFVLTVIPTAN